MSRWDEWLTLVLYVVLVRDQGRAVVVGGGPLDDL